jgi:hypothetical protein
MLTIISLVTVIIVRHSPSSSRRHQKPQKEVIQVPAIDPPLPKKILPISKENETLLVTAILTEINLWYSV